jgi:hypothetical protein
MDACCLVVRTSRGRWHWIRASAHALGLLGAVSVFGCARQQSLPDPDPIARRFAAAARRGDADAIYDMLSGDGQRAYGRVSVRVLVAQSAPELARQGEALDKGPRAVEEVARVRLSHGEIVVVTLEGGSFKISSAGVLPARARTPPEALGQLRDALAHRSYAALIRVLSGETRSTLDGDLNGLVRGLEHPDMLEPQISGDRAEVVVPGGHWVKLKREEGVWRVEDFR